ncbi:hypothetical protein ATANTOWER_026349 [Ataeniobius toweri]|uniref:Secreted protein n=1 Tax=Ataeniobius toweri TaxID=208326 RepID=A0ABU7AI41_9TELE|nr:hypothetical protein [Ataeniobius toweri]
MGLGLLLIVLFRVRFIGSFVLISSHLHRQHVRTHRCTLFYQLLLWGTSQSTAGQQLSGRCPSISKHNLATHGLIQEPATLCSRGQTI